MSSKCGKPINITAHSYYKNLRLVLSQLVVDHGFAWVQCGSMVGWTIVACYREGSKPA